MIKKVVAIWVSLVMLLGFVVIVDVVTEITPPVKAVTITVDDSGGADYLTIQEGIDAANPGDTVFVYSGTYIEDININKTINLTGEDRDSTIIDGNWGFENSTIFVSSDWVNITGFTIIQGQSGIYLISSHNSIIGNNISFCGFGIESWASSNNNIKNNYISNYDIGIYLGTLDDGGIGNKITDNIVVNNRLIGIGLRYSEESYLNNNTMINNGISINGNLVKQWNTHHIDTTNIVNGKPIYYWKNQTGGIVPEGAGQVLIANCTNVSIINQEFNNCSVGIELGFSSNNSIIRNNISHNNYGNIHLYFSDRNNITNNNLSDNRISLYYSDRTNIKNNRISGDSLSQCIILYLSNMSEIKGNIITEADSGIRIIYSEKNNITGNEIFDNVRGIQILSNRNNIFRNNISNNNRGIDIKESKNNDVTFNNICLNRNYGIYLTSAENNNISQNNFINNNIQGFDDTGKNFWNSSYPIGGNFWNDYLGIDEKKGPNQNISGNDGIGDTAYLNIEGGTGVEDKYPLMSPTGNNLFFYEGWNLISIPFVPSGTNIDSVLSSINSSYDAIQWYNISDKSDPWKHKQMSKPYLLNDLKVINQTKGFWIHITEPSGILFNYSGTQPTPNQSITLYPGWNMVGYPSLCNRTRDNALNNINYGTDVDAIWTFNAATQTWQEIGQTDYFELGRGYWIHSKVTKVWDVPL